MSLLSINNLSFSYREDYPILEDICLQLNEGEIFCLLGPNGSGKTTLLSQIINSSLENKKFISINDVLLSALSIRDKAKCIGFVPQKIVSMHISVYQTVIMGRYPYSKGFSMKPDKEDYRITEEAIELMGLSRLVNRQLNTLSGGEVQRVFIAQSIAKNAKIYLFDEPMAALDPEYQAEFLKTIVWLSQQKKAIIFTTHNPNHCFGLSNAKIGIIDREHRLIELSNMSYENIKIIENTFDHSVQIKYSEAHNAFVSTFRL